MFASQYNSWKAHASRDVMNSTESSESSYDATRHSGTDIFPPIVKPSTPSTDSAAINDVTATSDVMKQSADDVTTIHDVTKQLDCTISAILQNLQKLQQTGKLTDIKITCSDGLVLGVYLIYSTYTT